MKKLNILIVSLVIILTLPSCNWGKKKAEKQKVTIGMVTFPGYAPLYLAKEKGFFGDLDVQLVRIEAIGDLRAALSSGKIDMYASTYDIFQANQGNDVPGIGFMLIDESHGADGIVGAEGLNSIKDLKGKKLAGEPGLPPYFLLQYLLNKENLSMKDISFKDIATQDAGAAFTSGSVDAAAIYEPFLSNAAKARKGSKIIVSSAEAPNILADLLFASDKLYKNNPEVLKGISEGWFKSLEYIKSNPDDAYTVMGKAFNVSKQDMIDFKSVMTWYTKEDNIKMFDKSNTTNVYQIFQLVGDVLEKNGSAKMRFKPEDKVTNSIVNKFTNETGK
jgi:NitT/TauT family transport system substrate-binding protein